MSFLICETSIDESVSHMKTISPKTYIFDRHKTTFLYYHLQTQEGESCKGGDKRRDKRKERREKKKRRDKKQGRN